MQPKGDKESMQESRTVEECEKDTSQHIPDLLWCDQEHDTRAGSQT